MAKSKKKNCDFQKVKLRVGKKLLKGNVTKPVIKAKKLTVVQKSNENYDYHKGQNRSKTNDINILLENLSEHPFGKWFESLCKIINNASYNIENSESLITQINIVAINMLNGADLKNLGNYVKLLHIMLKLFENWLKHSKNYQIFLIFQKFLSYLSSVFQSIQKALNYPMYTKPISFELYVKNVRKYVMKFGITTHDHYAASRSEQNITDPLNFFNDITQLCGNIIKLISHIFQTYLLTNNNPLEKHNSNFIKSNTLNIYENQEQTSQKDANLCDFLRLNLTTLNDIVYNIAHLWIIPLILEEKSEFKKRQPHIIQYFINSSEILYLWIHNLTYLSSKYNFTVVPSNQTLNETKKWLYLDKYACFQNLTTNIFCQHNSTQTNSSSIQKLGLELLQELCNQNLAQLYQLSNLKLSSNDIFPSTSTNMTLSKHCLDIIQILEQDSDREIKHSLFLDKMNIWILSQILKAIFCHPTASNTDHISITVMDSNALITTVLTHLLRHMDKSLANKSDPKSICLKKFVTLVLQSSACYNFDKKYTLPDNINNNIDKNDMNKIITKNAWFLKHQPFIIAYILLFKWIQEYINATIELSNDQVMGDLILSALSTSVQMLPMYRSFIYECLFNPDYMGSDIKNETNILSSDLNFYNKAFIEHFITPKLEKRKSNTSLIQANAKKFLDNLNQFCENLENIFKHESVKTFVTCLTHWLQEI